MYAFTYKYLLCIIYYYLYHCSLAVYLYYIVCHIHAILLTYVPNQLIGRAPDKPTLQGVHIISGSVEERSLKNQKSTIKIVYCWATFFSFIFPTF